ncbi:MAG TPA: 6-phosphogluconolactonase [Pyrinomonadaceae bacterium]|jgi:6-phosphogluconolactonase
MRRLEKNGARIEVWANLAEASERGAQVFAEVAGESLSERKLFSVALSGGSTPKALFGVLARDAAREPLSRVWPCANIFWADERCVPPDDAQSNYRMAHEALLAHTSVDARCVHRMRGEEEPERAAREYAALLEREFGTNEPVFDLILLGMGADAHTASIFPRSPLLTDDETRLVAAPYVEKLRSSRLTLTLRVLNRARHILFLASGAEKAEPLRKVFASTERDPELPAGWVRPARGQLLWLLDEEAARLLS